MCCGDKRAALARRFQETALPAADATAKEGGAVTPAVQPTPAFSAAPLNVGQALPVRYLERSPVRVRGPVTGREYEFSAAHPVRAVDAQDAKPLLRTRFFTRAAGLNGRDH